MAQALLTQPERLKPTVDAYRAAEPSIADDTGLSVAEALIFMSLVADICQWLGGGSNAAAIIESGKQLYHQRLTDAMAVMNKPGE